MPRRPIPSDERRDRGGVVRYATAWLVGGAVVAALLVAVLGGDPEVSLPPVRETQLEDAARAARCELRRARARETLNPPVSGPRRGAPLRPGVYEDAERPEALVGALREGAIVVHYRADLPEERVEQLSELQLAVPDGTIVVPNRTRMRYQIAVTAWRHLLGCGRFTDATVDALRLFRGRFIGRGPDR